MQPEYLARLGPAVQGFVLEVERQANIEIHVIPEPGLNRGGPFGRGQLEVLVEPRRNVIFVPTNGYFPGGAVRHELLLLKRIHVDGVPKLTTAASARGWHGRTADPMSHLDNAIEHIVIVPLELQEHPERRLHWEAVMQEVCVGLPDVPDEERSLAVCMHWTFLRHVLPGSPQAGFVTAFTLRHGLSEKADRFADQFLAVVARKEEAVRLLFHTFPGIPRDRAALEYISSSAGSFQTPIP